MKRSSMGAINFAGAEIDCRLLSQMRQAKLGQQIAMDTGRKSGNKLHWFVEGDGAELEQYDRFH
jgi:hypothetical protein